MSAESAIEKNGTDYTVLTGSAPYTVKVFRRNGEYYLTVSSGIRTNDVLADPSGHRYTVANTQVEYVRNEPKCIKAVLEDEYTARQRAPSVYVENMTNSVLSTGANAVITYQAAKEELLAQRSRIPAEDVEQFDRLIEAIEGINKKDTRHFCGCLNEFSLFLNRHSWVSSPIANILLTQALRILG